MECPNTISTLDQVSFHSSQPVNQVEISVACGPSRVMIQNSFSQRLGGWKFRRDMFLCSRSGSEEVQTRFLLVAIPTIKLGENVEKIVDWMYAGFSDQSIRLVDVLNSRFLICKCFMPFMPFIPLPTDFCQVLRKWGWWGLRCRGSSCLCMAFKMNLPQYINLEHWPKHVEDEKGEPF